MRKTLHRAFIQKKIGAFTNTKIMKMTGRNVLVDTKINNQKRMIKDKKQYRKS